MAVPQQAGRGVRPGFCRLQPNYAGRGAIPMVGRLARALDCCLTCERCCCRSMPAAITHTASDDALDPHLSVSSLSLLSENGRRSGAAAARSTVMGCLDGTRARSRASGRLWMVAAASDEDGQGPQQSDMVNGNPGQKCGPEHVPYLAYRFSHTLRVSTALLNPWLCTRTTAPSLLGSDGGGPSMNCVVIRRATWRRQPWAAPAKLQQQDADLVS